MSAYPGALTFGPGGTKLVDGLDTILPNASVASREWSALIRKSRKIEPSDEGFDRPLSDEEVSLMRYARGVDFGGRYRKFGPRWGRGLKLYVSLLPAGPRRRFEVLAKTLNLWRMRSEAQLQSVLDEWGDLAKKHGKLLFPYWKYWVNLESFGGYMPAADLSTFEAALRFWVQGNVEHTYPDENDDLTEKAFFEVFEEGVKDYLFSAPNIAVANARYVTIMQYTNEPGRWAGSGSSSKRSTWKYRDLEGKLRNPRKSKWVSAVGIAPAEVRRSMLNRNWNEIGQVNSAVQKREVKKVRAVVSSEIESYWDQDHAGDWFENALYGSILSTLTMSSREHQALYEGMAKSSSDDTVKIPLDQSKFDHQVNKRMIQIILKIMIALVKTKAPSEIRLELVPQLEKIRDVLTIIPGHINLGHGKDVVKILIEKGILSGWRWTALLDTIVNIAEMHAAKKLLDRYGFSGTVTDLVAQGDDDKVEVPSYGYAAGLVLAYQLMGFKINDSKFFVDTKRDEYLRQVSEDEVTSGYPARVINALLWRNPINKDPPRGLLRARETVKNWNLALSRGLDPDRVAFNMRKDVMRGNGLSSDDYDCIMRTPATAGGIGWNVEPGRWCKLSPGVVTVTNSIDTSGVRGLDPEIKSWKRLGVEFNRRTAMKALSGNFEYPRPIRDVIPGSVVSVPVMRPSGWTPVAGGSVPLVCPSDPLLPVTLREAALSKMKQDRELDWIRNVYVAPEYRAISRSIEQQGGRRVWFAWLEGKLPFAVPTVPGWSDLSVGVLAKAYARGAWSRLTSLSDFNWTTIVRASLRVERRVRADLVRARYRVGG